MASSSTSTSASPSAPPARSHIQIHFGETPRRAPAPALPSSYSHSRSPKKAASAEPAQNFDEILPQKQMKSMSDIDKEEEARLSKSHGEKAKRMGSGVWKWALQLTKGKGA